MKKVDRWKQEMPTEQEMLPKDKYTVFDRKVKRYRKGIHSEWPVPYPPYQQKWTFGLVLAVDMGGCASTNKC